MKTWRFELATLLGLIPASFLLARFGGELSQTNLSLAMNAMLPIGLLVATPLIFRLIRPHNNRDRETRK